MLTVHPDILSVFLFKLILKEISFKFQSHNIFNCLHSTVFSPNIPASLHSALKKSKSERKWEKERETKTITVKYWKKKERSR